MPFKISVPCALATGAAGATSTGCYFQMCHRAVGSASEDAQAPSNPSLANLVEAANSLNEILPTPKETSPSSESESPKEKTTITPPVAEQKTLKDKTPNLVGTSSDVAKPGAENSSPSQLISEKPQIKSESNSIKKSKTSSITDNRIIPRGENGARRGSSAPVEKTYDENQNSTRSNASRSSSPTPKKKPRPKKRARKGSLFCSIVHVPLWPVCE